MESARTTFVPPLKFCAIDRTDVFVLLMKSDTSTPGDMPKSRWFSPASDGPAAPATEVKQLVAVPAPCASNALLV